MRLPEEVQAQGRVAVQAALWRAGSSQGQGANRQKHAENDEHGHADFGHLFNAALEASGENPRIQRQAEDVKDHGLVGDAQRAFGYVDVGFKEARHLGLAHAVKGLP